MTANPSSPSETEKLRATLHELEAERQRRIRAGEWSRDPRPTLHVEIPKLFGTEPNVFHMSAIWQYLTEHPGCGLWDLAHFKWVITLTDEPEWKPIVQPKAAELFEPFGLRFKPAWT